MDQGVEGCRLLGKPDGNNTNAVLNATSGTVLFVRGVGTRANGVPKAPTGLWDAITKADLVGIEYTPQVWGGDQLDTLLGYANLLEANPGHLLTFNEPDESEFGSNLSPVAAAELWATKLWPYMNKNYPSVKLVSPGPSGDKAYISYLADFMGNLTTKTCGTQSCDKTVYAVAHHSCMQPLDGIADCTTGNCCNFKGTIGQLEGSQWLPKGLPPVFDIAKKYNTKVWLTELGCDSQNITEVTGYAAGLIDYLLTDPQASELVERAYYCNNCTGVWSDSRLLPLFEHGTSNLSLVGKAWLRWLQ